MAFSVEWDPTKAATNAARHGITFEEAATVFGDPLARIVEDDRHSQAEPRFAIVGHSYQSRVLAVMFTERGENSVRLISARLATSFERHHYEEGSL